ncbi:MAG: glycosyltransferase family 9 protein [Chlorobi bacterium]|nr:glycosyltransferase family 9 protein [Chlorobiota bacterium]
MSTVKTILVIRLSSIGDIILSTPLLRELAVAFPDARIDYCTKALFAGLLAGNPRVHVLHTPVNPPSGSYDLVVDLQNNRRSRRIVRKIRAGKVVRYRKENWKKWLLVRFRMDFTGPYRSVPDRYRDALADFRVPGDTGGCELYPSPEERNYAASLSDSRNLRLAVCFGAMHASKRYPGQKFAGVLSLLFEALPLQAVLLGGPSDAPFAADILQALPEPFRGRVVDLSGRCTLMQTAAVLERCDGVLCNDTGLMHMASAFDKKLFVLFGSSVPAFGFLPYHAPYELFETAGLRCRPCSHIGRDVCPEGHFRCMHDLQEVAVAGKIMEYFSHARS